MGWQNIHFSTKHDTGSQKWHPSEMHSAPSCVFLVSLKVIVTSFNSLNPCFLASSFPWLIRILPVALLISPLTDSRPPRPPRLCSRPACGHRPGSAARPALQRALPVCLSGRLQRRPGSSAIAVQRRRHCYEGSCEGNLNLLTAPCGESFVRDGWCWGGRRVSDK